jgi:hypothetical protein
MNRDDTSGEMIPHGDPAVCATPFADIAIFRSIINRKNLPEKHGSRFGGSIEGTKSLRLYFEVTETIDEQIRNNSEHLKGRVYFFDKNDFNYFSPIEVRANKLVKPLGVVLVNIDDLPDYSEYIVKTK